MANTDKGFGTALPGPTLHRKEHQPGLTTALFPNVPRFAWWWWWEIGAAVLSITTMMLILVLIFIINNKSLQAWTLPIQPNSLLAVLTTISKTSMMVPIASCISQLKWRHFLLRPRPLIQLQEFDDASRGPWGSVVLIYRFTFHVKAFITLGLAVASILALGIDPSAQQIISFDSRQTRVENTSVLMSKANGYFSRAWDVKEKTLPYFPGEKAQTEAQQWMRMLQLRAQVSAAVSGSISEPYFNCPEPALECSWDNFSTLGVCAQRWDITHLTKRNCSAAVGSTSNNGSCQYWYPNDNAGAPPFEDPTLSRPITLTYFDMDLGVLTDMFISRPSNNKSSLALLWTMKNMTTYPDYKGTVTSAFESQVSELYFCIKSFRDVTASSQGIKIGSTTTARFRPETNMTACLAAARPQGDCVYYPDMVGRYVGDRTIVSWFQDTTTSTDYSISTNIWTSMHSYFEELFRLNITAAYQSRGGDQNAYATWFRPEAELAYAFYQNNVTTIAYNLAEALSAYIQTAEPSGDNLNATKISGYMLIDETYIRVQWPWLILPLGETLATVALLAVTILVSRGQPLQKSSAIALLFQGLSGWERELDESRPESWEEQELLAEGMTAQLARDRRGLLGFRRSGMNE